MDALMLVMGKNLFSLMGTERNLSLEQNLVCFGWSSLCFSKAKRTIYLLPYNPAVPLLGIYPDKTVI